MLLETSGKKEKGSCNTQQNKIMKIKTNDLKEILKEELRQLSEDDLGYPSEVEAVGPVPTEADEILARLQELADGVGLALEPCVGSYIVDLSHRLRGR